LQVHLNGEVQTLQDHISLAELVVQLQLAPSRIAIELNRVVVRRSEWSATSINDGDRIEIVHFVGGGDRVYSPWHRGHK
jgi:thiamine biosynthesis protein ThiS